SSNATPLGTLGSSRCALVERQLGYGAADVAAANLDLETPARAGARGGDEAEPDALLERRREASARHPAHGLSFLVDRESLTGDGAVRQREADQAAGDAFAFLPAQGFRADEVALVQLDGPPVADLERRHRLVHVVPVQEKAGLQPQRVPRAEP